MHDPQPQLPFGEQNTLEEIRRLLETQNELLRSLVNRLNDPMPNRWPEDSRIFDETGDDESIDELADDDEFWDDVFDEEADEETLPDPPVWFAQHYPWE